MFDEFDDDDLMAGVMDAAWRESRVMAWRRLEKHVQGNYHAPDIEGIKIIACAAAAHTLLPKMSPIWLFVIGASGTGKSSLVGSVMQGLPYYNVLSNITPQTFMSGLQLGKKTTTGLLQRLGDSILFWVSDLSSITSMREDGRLVVMAQLREMYDGTIHKDYGNGKVEDWKGKCTLIAGCTPAVETQWGTQRDLGERFLNVRWRAGDEEELAIMAALMEDEGDTRTQTTEFTRQWVGDLIALREFVPMLTRQQIIDFKFHTMAATVAQLRVSIQRDKRNTSQIVEIGTAEGPGRIIKTLTGIATTHAALMGKEAVDNEDWLLAQRVARESVPGRRGMILSSFADTGKSSMSVYDMQLALDRKKWGVSTSTVRNNLEDLVALGALSSSEHSGQKFYSPTEWWNERKELLGWQ